MRGYFVGWKEGCIALLIITTAANRFGLSVGGYNVRPETLAILVVGPCCLISLARARSWPDLTVADWLLLAWLLQNFVASFGALQPADSLKYSVLYALMATIYLAFPRLCDNLHRLRMALDCLLIVSVLVCIYAVITALAFHYVGLNLGIHMAPASGAPTIRGTLWEANILGSYLAAASLVFLSAMHSPVYVRPRLWLTVGLVLTSCGLILSMARGAWLGFACALVFALVFIGKRRVLSRLAVVALLCALLIALLVGATLRTPTMPTASVTQPTGIPESENKSPVAPANPILGRLQSVLRLGTDASTFWRARLYAMALDHWRERFVLGWGPGGFRQAFPVIETVDPENIWIASLFVRSLHDTGVLGLGLLVAFIATLAASAWKAWKSATEPVVRLCLSSMLTCGVAFLVSFQVTDAVLLGYPWIYAGILAAGTAQSGGCRRAGHESCI